MTSSSSSSPCVLLSPAVPAAVKDVISKEESCDPFEEHFGTRNKSGETVLYEASAEIVRVAIFAYANGDESCEHIATGRVSIIFYPEIGEIRVILQAASSHSWPVRNERIDQNQIFDYDGWFWRDDGRDRMCRRREDLNPSEAGRGVVFGDWNYYGVAFGTEEEVSELRAAIRSIQRRMSRNEIPKDETIRDSFSLEVSRFFCLTGVRASSLEIVCIHVGSVWRINGNYSVEHDKSGTIALALRKQTPGGLEMIVVFRTRNGDDVEDVRKCYRVSTNLKLVASHIAPQNRKDFVWEWEISGDSWACAFVSSEEVESFKEIIDFYVSDLKKSSKKLFGGKLTGN